MIWLFVVIAVIISIGIVGSGDGPDDFDMDVGA